MIAFVICTYTHFFAVLADCEHFILIRQFVNLSGQLNPGQHTAAHVHVGEEPLEGIGGAHADLTQGLYQVRTRDSPTRRSSSLAQVGEP